MIPFFSRRASDGNTEISQTMTLRPFILILCFLLVNGLTLQAQPRGSIKGRVLDDSTRSPLPLANIFISNSTIGAASKDDGAFELKGVPIGSHQVVASLVGYQPGIVAVRLVDSTLMTVEIRLKPRAVQLPGVEVEAKDPAEWREQLDDFLKEFIGTTSNAKKCRILNPEVLDFFEESPHMVARAREQLEIENRALGYHIRCVLVHYGFSRTSMQFIVLTSYQNLVPKDKAEESEWNENRIVTFRGSQRHFFLSLLRKNTKVEGFEVNRIKKNQAHNAFARPIGFEVDADTLLKSGEHPFQSILSFPDILQVIYYTGNIPQVSLIEMNRPRLVVYPNGHIEDPLGLWTYGYWSTQRFADMLPIDFEPR